MERAGPAVVFHLEKGRLVIEEDTGELHDLVHAVALFDPGCGVIVDLQKLRQLDCSGIGQLVQLRGEVCDSGGVFSLVNVAPRHRRLLDLLGLLRVLPVFASQEEAITACWSARARGCVPSPARPEWLRVAVRPTIGGALQPRPAV
ncbi:MAG TPA: STAS domain-containing protein [Vicinamibacteria bacterium]|nr:STAS domain-containing protein [Vicinamibacteria bacterium]